jgi:MFS family permease
MNLFKIRNYVIAVIVGSIGQMSYYAFNVLWPTQASLLYTTDNITLGWMGSTTGVALVLGELVMGPFLRYGHVRLQQVLACIGLAVFGGLMAYANEDRQSLAIAVSLICSMILLTYADSC